jgi:hypothetical protein
LTASLNRNRFQLPDFVHEAAMPPSRLHGVFLAAPLLASPLLAAASGTVTGRVLDEAGRPVAGARVRLENKVSGYRQAVRSGADGRFALRNIPFNDYHLEVEAPGLMGHHRDLEVRVAVPLELQLSLRAAGAEVVVEEHAQLVEEHASTHLNIDQSTIDKIPTASRSRSLENILLATPGFTQDENGRFHMKGSHGQVTYVVDGIPVSDQVQATFSNAMDPGAAESLQVITGGISAEYGGKPVAVVAMTTKSGLGSEGFSGEASLGLARFGTAEAAVTARGGGAAFGYFATATTSRSDRFLDPVNFENLHNRGASHRLHSRFDWLLGASDTLRFSAGGGRTERDVPNLASQEARGQDQRVRHTDLNLSLAWSHVFDASRSLDAALFYRHASARLDPTRDLAPGFAGGGPDFPVWARQDRKLDNQGLQIGYTQRFGENSVKAGLQAVRYPLREAFRFAITDPDLVTDPDDPLHPYTPAGGGRIFSFDGAMTPTLTSAYVQSEWHLRSFFVAAGLRFDRYAAGGAVSSELQPRLGVSYTVAATGTVLRASYDRLLITPENENLALSLSQAARDLGPYAGTPVPALSPELQHSFAYGLEQQVGGKLRFSLEYWEKRAVHAADNEQFMNTGVPFPVAAARGLYRGLNARVDLVPVKGFSAYLSAGKTRAIFQAPLAGGLQLEAPERAPGERFLIDHDQKLAAQLGLRFESEGFYAQLVGRHDSGLVAGDPAEADGDPDLDFGTPFVRLDGEGTWRIRPRTVWSLALGRDFKLPGGRALQLGADLLNLTDAKGLYNFLSVFGGTHVIPPRTFALRAKLKF